MGAATINLTHYQFQDDGADANTSSLIGSEDTTNIALDLDTTYFIRFGVTNTGGMSANNYNYRLEADIDGAGFFQVTTSSTFVQLVDGGDADGDPITSQRLANDGGGFVNGLYEESGDTPTYTLVDGNETEHVYAIQFLSADLTAGSEEIDLRLTNAGTLLDNYGSAFTGSEVTMASLAAVFPYHIIKEKRRAMRTLLTG